MRFFLLAALLASASLQSAKPQYNAQELYSAVRSSIEAKKWEVAAEQAATLVHDYPDSPFCPESLFYLGEANFERGDYELADNYFTTYLQRHQSLARFREAIEFKFRIAQKFQQGAKKHLFGSPSLPQWVPVSNEELVKLYDEVIAALPNDELAAEALFGKAKAQLDEEEFSQAIETLQTLIRRFPRLGLASQSYVEIAKIYLLESKEKFPDIDFLDLARINARKFSEDFPTDEKLQEVRSLLVQMEEVYAEDYYTIGQFFERTKKPRASSIYYKKILKTYPETRVAKKAEKRLAVLEPKAASPQDLEGPPPASPGPAVTPPVVDEPPVTGSPPVASPKEEHPPIETVEPVLDTSASKFLPKHEPL